MFEAATTLEADLGGLLESLARVGEGLPVDGSADGSVDGFRVDLLTALERVKSGCAAAQARVTADLVESQGEVSAQWRDRASECAASNDFAGWRAARDAEHAASCAEDCTDPAASSQVGVRRGRRGGQDAVCGVAGQVALARRVSPHRGSRHVSTALALVGDLPFVMAALTQGVISERRAEIVVTETAALTSEQRQQVDASLRVTVGDGLGTLGDRDLARRVRAAVYTLDPENSVARCRYAEGQRRVTLRPAPDAMTWLTALLPVAQGVATMAALTRDAATITAAAKAEGDGRSKGQVMADRLVELVTGQAVAAEVPVEVQLVMTDQTLFGTDTNTGARGATTSTSTSTGNGARARAGRGAGTAGFAGPAVGQPGSALVRGYGPIPAAVARDLVATRAEVWVRRLLTDPVDGTLTAMDTSRRLFDGPLRRYLLARDGTCRTPWCDAPIRHADHIVPHAQGGQTSVANGQGLCVRCNLTKEQPGWRQRVTENHPHTVEIETPTGHRYQSQAPPVLPPVDIRWRSPLERAVELWPAA